MHQKTIPLKDFFRNPERTNYAISPNGKYLSFMAPYEGRLNVFVQEISGSEPRRLTNVTERDIAKYLWGNDRTILYVKDNAGDENFHLYSVFTDGSGSKDLTPFNGVRANIVDELEDYESEILIELNKRNPEFFDVYRLNFETGEMKMTAENPGNVSGWGTDHKGIIRIALTTDGVNNGIMYRDSEADKFKTIITTNFREMLAPLFFTFDDKNIYAASNLGRDKAAIVEYDIKNNKELKVLFEHPDVDVNILKYSKKRKVLTAISYYTHKIERVILDDEIRSIYEKLGKELEGYEITIVDSDDNEDKYVVSAYNDRTNGSYYIYDQTDGSLTKINDVTPWINEDEMSEMKPVTFMSRDGLKLNGYLTLPKGKEPKDLPVVLNPHGGPWARDYWGFNPEVQFLANRGYAVLQINFRGSVGYGRKFWESSFKQWGRKMQDDLTDGVKWLEEQGIADPKRVAIYGGSYGGYAVLAGLAFTPDLYACGV
ncbi:MAG: S9 family peptidase, partial [Ignavibacteria bacterium]|nr:S9 family peptidase [Ignavibacteria bacterium]